jgi:hypothetical protein
MILQVSTHGKLFKQKMNRVTDTSKVKKWKNSKSAKAYQSANSQLDNIITKSESGIFNNQLEPLYDPKQLDK